MARHALALSRHPEDYCYIAAAFAPPPDIAAIAPPGLGRGIKVGIIGGGLAGMSAAFELRKAGFDSTVFEANPDRLGGRIYTCYFDGEKRLYGELGAMRLPVAHEAVWHYIDLFGLNTRPFIQTNPAAFIYLQDTRVRNDPNGEGVRRYIYPFYEMYPWETQLSWQTLGFYGIEAPALQPPPWVRQEILKVLPVYSPQILQMDSLSTRQTMERQGLSQGAISMLSNLFPIGGRFLYHNYLDFVQEYFPANFIYMYEISGGMVKLPEAFRNSFLSPNPESYYPRVPGNLLGNVTWKSGCAVKGLYWNEETGGATLSYCQKNSKALASEDFDYIICAIPFSVLRTLDIRPLFTPVKMQAIREVTYSPAQKTAFLCRRRFWEEQGIYGGGSYTDLPANTLWYPSSDIRGNSYAAGADGIQSEGVFLAYSFNLDGTRIGNLPDGERLATLERNVEKVHGLAPGALDAIVAGYRTQYWDRDPYYRGTFCYFTPEQKRLFSWVMVQPEYSGRVFFAGEHISGVHRWMQGALHSGMAAANSVACAARTTLLVKMKK
jgi:monoamine oxidase